MSVRDRIFFRGIVLFARDGESAHAGQRFEIDLDTYLDVQPYASRDDFSRALDYGALYGAVKEVVETRRTALIESLADMIAERVLVDFPLVTGVRVEVRTPAAPIAGVFGAVGVEVRREREGDGQ